MKILCPLIVFFCLSPLIAAEPVKLGGQRHMFIDDDMLASKEHVTFRVVPPMLRGPVLKNDKDWENLAEYSSVLDDGKQFFMYYCNPGDGRNHVCVATSTDGLNWTKPNLGLHSFGGSTANNIVITGTCSGTTFYDPKDPDPARRYKYFTCQIGDDKPGTKTTEGMVLYNSPDGIHFTKHEVQLLPFNADSQAVAFYDTNINKYVCYMRGNDGDIPGSRGRKVVRAETDNPLKPWPYTKIPDPFWHDHEMPYATRELTTVLRTSPDIDPHETDFYGSQAFLYPWARNVYLAFPTTYYHYKDGRLHLTLDGKGGNVGVGEVQIAVSRDGIKWTRYPRPAYIRHGMWGDSYVGWPWMLQGMFRRDDKILQYVSLRRSGHGGREFEKSRSHAFDGFCLFEQQADRFVAAEFEYTGGSITTEPFTFEGNRLSLNFDTGATGEGRVGILNADGSPVPGFAVTDCEILNRDVIAKTVTWRGKSDVSSLAGKPIRLRFEMRGAQLFAMQFVQSAQ